MRRKKINCFRWAKPKKTKDKGGAYQIKKKKKNSGSGGKKKSWEREYAAVGSYVSYNDSGVALGARKVYYTLSNSKWFYSETNPRKHGRNGR